MTSTRLSTVVKQIVVRLMGAPEAFIPTRTVTLQLTAAKFFRLCNGIDPTSKKDVTFAIAHELFDLSNNPARDEERGQVWKGKNPDGTDGGAHSLSVCDVIEVEFCDGVTMAAICLPFGWHVSSMGADMAGANDGMILRDFLALMEAMLYRDRQDAVRSLSETEEQG